MQRGDWWLPEESGGGDGQMLEKVKRYKPPVIK